MGRLEGKSAIITGAGRGIGKAIARKFLEEGARILICDIVAERLEATAGELRALGEVRSMDGDVSAATFCDALVARALEHFGTLDVLVNNAGIAIFQPFLDHSEEAWDRTLAVNLKSVFLLGQRAARAMVAQGRGGAIVNMASTNGHVGEKELAAYNASKAGVVLLTKTMAIELAPHNIRANCIAPGFIRTELVEDAGGALVVLQHGDHDARQGEPRAVQRVHVLRLRAGLGPEANLGAAGLEVLEVAARRDFQPLLAAGRPDFDVQLVGGLEREVTGTHLHDAVAQAKFLADCLGVGQQAPELVRRVFRAHELDHLDLVELVPALDAAYIASGRHLLPAPARCVGDMLDRQRRAVQNLFAVEIRDRDLRRRDEPEIVLVIVVQVVAELREIARAVEADLLDDERRIDFDII